MPPNLRILHNTTQKVDITQEYCELTGFLCSIVNVAIPPETGYDDTLMWIVVLMYALFATVFPVGRMTLAFGSPFFLCGLRMVAAGLILLGAQAVWNRSELKCPRRLWPLIFLAALFCVFLTNALEFWGLQWLPSAQACMLYTISTFTSIFLSYWMLGERMNKNKWIALAVGFTGAIPMFWGEATFDLSPAKIAVTAGAIAAALGWIYMKQLVVREKYPILLANAITFILGGLMSFATSLVTEPWDPFPVIDWRPFLYGTIYITLIHNVLCYNLYAYSLQRFTVTFMLFAGILNPLFTAVFAWFLLEESVGLPFFLSVALVCLALRLYISEEKRLQRGVQIS